MKEFIQEKSLSSADFVPKHLLVQMQRHIMREFIQEKNLLDVAFAKKLSQERVKNNYMKKHI